MGDGLRIENAGDDGVQVSSAAYGVNIVNTTADGILIQNAGDEGIEVTAASGNGVQANSTGVNRYGGYFTNSVGAADEGYGVYAKSNRNSAADLVLGADSSLSTEGAGLVISDPEYMFSDIRIESADEIEFQIDAATEDATSAFTVFDGDNNEIFQIDEAGNIYITGVLNASHTFSDLRVPEGELSEIVSTQTETIVDTVALDGGRAIVMLPDQIASQIDSSTYQVFLTPVGGYCPLYVAEKSQTQFIIAADNGSECTISVDYQLVVEVVSMSKTGGEE